MSVNCAKEDGMEGDTMGSGRDERDIAITPPHKPSYWHSPGIEPMSAMTLGQLVDVAAEQWPKREAFVSLYQGHRYTFAELREKTDILAAGLTQLGLSPGDRVGIWGPNSSEWYLSRLAAARGGFIAVQIDPLYQPPQLLHALTKVGAKALICPGDSFYLRLRAIIPELDIYPESGVEIKSDKIPSIKFLIIFSDKKYRGAYSFGDIMSSASPDSVQKIRDLQTLIDPDDGTCILFSSGTTGHPKAVLLSHKMQVNNAYFFGKWINEPNINNHRLVVPVLFCHMSGSMCGIFTLRYGHTLVVVSAAFDTKKMLEAVIEVGGSMLFATPSLFCDMIAKARQHEMKFTTLKYVGYGGAPCPMAVALEMKEVFNVKRLVPMYGMSETGVNFVGRPEDTLEEMTSTVGCLTGYSEMKVVDENGRMVPMGTPGELWIRSYALMKEYWGDKEKTEEFITKDGWGKTGDVFILKDGGYGKIVGRIKDVIIRIGDKIFPIELEEFFQEHPDVQETQVFGVPDPKVGEEICAYFRLKEGVTLNEKDIVEYCKGKIPDYRIPRYIRFAYRFPLSPVGKVMKSKLLETLQSEIGEV